MLRMSKLGRWAVTSVATAVAASVVLLLIVSYMDSRNKQAAES